MTRALTLSALTLAVGTAVAPAALAAPTVTTQVTGVSATPTAVTKGKAFTLTAQAQKVSGKTWAPASGASAVIFFDADGSAPNTAQRTVTTNARGAVSASFTPAISGYWSVQLKATATNKLSTSSRVYVRVASPAPVVTPPVAAGGAVVMPRGSVSCPASAPIKGNASSHIFHMPGQRYYAITHPEMCFSTTAAAIRAGYRASKI